MVIYETEEMTTTSAESCVALIGLGAIGLGAHLPALLRSSRVDVVLLVDPTEDRRAAARAMVGNGVRIASGIEAVLDDRTIGAVVLATPPWVTPELAARLLSSGRFVLAEKPIATSTGATTVLTELPANARARLQVGLTYRHDPAIARLRSWTVGGQLGAPVLARAHVYDEARDAANPDHTERILRMLSHGSPVMHEGSHVFDWLSYIFGAVPDTICDAWSMRTSADVPAPNLVGARLQYPGGNTGMVEFGWLTEGLPRCEVSLLGNCGYAVLDGFTFELSLSTDAEVEYIAFPGERTARCFDLQLDRFVDLATGLASEASPGLTDGVAALRTSEQVDALATAGTLKVASR